MALQFILGSSRSGKTDFIYEQMIKDSMEHEDEEFFFLVPDQSTLNAQRQLVQRHPRKRKHAYRTVPGRNGIF